jgi:hypothetical protein
VRRLVALEAQRAEAELNASHESRRQRQFWSKVRAMAAIVVLLAGLGLLVVSIWFGHRQLGAENVLTTSKVAPRVSVADHPLGCLGRFLQATTWDDRRACVVNPDRIDKAANAYYQGRDPDEIRPSDFKACAPAALRGVPEIATFQALRGERRPVLAAFRRVNGQWKLDWETFAQTYDERFSDFIRHPDFKMQTFRARVERVFPVQGKSDAFRVAVCDELDASQRIEVELTAGSLLRDRVAAGLVANPSRPATVEMCWYQSSEDGGWQPALQNLICWGWCGLTGEPESPQFSGVKSAAPVRLARARGPSEVRGPRK